MGKAIDGSQDEYEDSEREVLLSYALCTTNGELLVDGQIKEHFDKATPGLDISNAAKEFYGATETEWGNAINVSERSRTPATD